MPPDPSFLELIWFVFFYYGLAPLLALALFLGFFVFPNVTSFARWWLLAGALVALLIVPFLLDVFLPDLPPNRLNTLIIFEQLLEFAALAVVLAVPISLYFVHRWREQAAKA